MNYTIINTGGSRSFPATHPLLERSVHDTDVIVIIGAKAGIAYQRLANTQRKLAILIELGSECLGVYTGEGGGEEGSNTLGFARFRLGEGEPSALVELVCQPNTTDAALTTARRVFEESGLQVALCRDFPGRIIDRLARPYYNAALRRLDEGLATAQDLDTTLRLGLGYPEGPISLLERTGLHHHFDVTQALFETFGEPAYAPARRARVAKQRQGFA
jgi:3-hydroxybutyryl-CoA dehydrogenase